MSNPKYPKELYLQNNLKLFEKRTVRNDARLVGLDRHSGPTAIPNYSIPLLDWIKERIDEGDLEINCNCPEPECNTPVAFADYFNILDNGKTFQLLDILQNDVFDPFLPVTINIISTDFPDNLSIEIINPINYSYPIIKLTKPSDSFSVNNMDEPAEFIYTITNSCGVSEPAQVTIFPVSVDIIDIIEQN